MLSFVTGWVARGLYDSGSLLVSPDRQVEEERLRGTGSVLVPEGHPKEAKEFQAPAEPPGGYKPLDSGAVNDLRM